jgi:Xaa-Pro dipeptidase
MDYVGRRNRLRSKFDEVGATALVVTNPSNVRYLTGFTGSNGAVVVGSSPDVDRLATDSRYYTQAENECPGLEVLPSTSTVLDVAVLWCADQAMGSVGFEAHHVTVYQCDQLRDRLPSLLVATSNLVEQLRIEKDDDERRLIARACAISDAALARLLPEVHVGVTERELAGRLSLLMREEGADGDSFESIVAGGPHSAIPHHQPTSRPLASGDLLKIDFGALLAGYHADETRTFVVGAEPQGWQSELHDLVAAAQTAGIAALRAGADCRDVDAAARSVIADAGYGEYFGHGLGHAVGLDIHEVPFLGATSPGILSVGTPITVEPGVYLPGRGGVRIEDTLVVGSEAPVALTTTTKELLVLGL